MIEAIITMFIAVSFNVFGKGYEVLLSLSIIVSIIISIYDSVRRKKLKLGFCKIAIIPAVIYSLYAAFISVVIAPMTFQAARLVI